MVTSSQPASAPSPAKAPNQAAIYADRAMGMMRSLNVLPTPRNYTLFFACSTGQPTELVKQIEATVAKKTGFSEEHLEQLYLTHIAEPQNRAIQDTAANAKKILNEMMHNVNIFTGETTAMSQQVTSQLEHLDEEASEEVVRLLANTLVESAQTMHNSSETMNARLVGAQKEIIELRENLARVMTEAERDFLTGCFNRKAFDKRLLDAMEHAKANNSEVTLLMLDIDHFKGFNDNFGHLIGDEVLKIVAKTLTDTLKGMDCVARYGGEEFAVILPRTPGKGGMVVAEVIRKSIAGKELKRKSTGENFGIITVSIGVATYRATDSAATLIQRADEAMYRSKKGGRNQVTQEVLA